MARHAVEGQRRFAALMERFALVMRFSDDELAIFNANQRIQPGNQAYELYNDPDLAEIVAISWEKR